MSFWGQLYHFYRESQVCRHETTAQQSGKITKLDSLVLGRGIGHGYFSVEKFRDPVSRRRTPAFSSSRMQTSFVLGRGLEPPRFLRHQLLRLTCLPISPPQRMRHGRESNPRITVLQTVVLPLHHRAACTEYFDFATLKSTPGWRNGIRRGLKIPGSKDLVSSTLTPGTVEFYVSIA